MTNQRKDQPVFETEYCNSVKSLEIHTHFHFRSW